MFLHVIYTIKIGMLDMNIDLMDYHTLQEINQMCYDLGMHLCLHVIYTIKIEVIGYLT